MTLRLNYLDDDPSSYRKISYGPITITKYPQFRVKTACEGNNRLQGKNGNLYI